MNSNLPIFSFMIRFLVSSLGTLCLVVDLKDFLLFSWKVLIVLHLNTCYILSKFLHNMWDIVYGSFLCVWEEVYGCSIVQHHILKMLSFFLSVLFAPCVKKSTGHICVRVFLDCLLYSIDWCVYPTAKTI